jgi:dihydrofolate reductase
MRKLIYLVAASLDGQICRRDGSFDCFPAEGDHIPDYLETLKTFGAVVMGRGTYEVGLRAGIADPYPHLDSYVFSKSMAASPNPRVQFVRDDVPAFVQGLKQQPGRDIYLCGGGRLAATLFKWGLIDEVIVKLNPLVIGAGIPLFDGLDEPAPLKLAGTKVYESGVVLLSYHVIRN